MVNTIIDGETFFIGSIFFTTAAFLQYLETANAPINLSMKIKDKLHILTWEPSRIDWWSTVVQLGGTIFFNIAPSRLYKASYWLVKLIIWFGGLMFMVQHVSLSLVIWHGLKLGIDSGP
jgi:hypothetical protein